MKHRLLVIQSPLFITATLLLFINDFWLKGLYPGMLTGKLSDFAGLFIFPLFLFVLIGKRKLLIFLLTGIGFIWWKSNFSTEFITLWNSTSPILIGRVVDYTDLLALLILPVSYYFKPVWLIRFNHSIWKYGLGTFTLFCILASETTEVRFKNKVTGTNPYHLIGDYELQTKYGDTIDIDTISIQRIRKSDYLVTNNPGDTLYYGEIRKKKRNYYLNRYDEKTDHWNISCFTISGDSIYNFQRALWGASEDIIKHFDWWDYEKVEEGEVTTYFIENEKKETLEAFSTTLEKLRGIYIKETPYIKDTVYSPFVQKTNRESTQEVIQNNWKVFPNPFINHITMEQSSPSGSTIKLINLSGQVIREEKTNQTALSWNLSKVEPGWYIIEILGNNGALTTLKILKE